jgi:threonine dehydratase
VAVAAKAINPQVRVIGVQPEASPAAYLSLRDGRPYEEYDATPTIADGPAGGFGRLPFEMAGHLIDEIVLVSEEEIRTALFTLLELAQLIVEGAGAVGIAALLASRVNLAGRKVVVILSGANIDASLLFEIMDEQSET